MEKNQIWIIVSISIFVAILASFITASITGNVIKLNEDKWGKYQGYTTAEVDAKINAITSTTSHNMKCSVFGGSMINESKTAYQNCIERGYQKLCLMHRVTVTSWYSSLNCSASGLKYEDTETGVLACDNKPESGDYSFCQSPMVITNGLPQQSMNTKFRDEVICCQ